MDNRRVLTALLPDGWRACPFEPFREGVEICALRGTDPQLALLRYAPGARVPRHRHAGLEIIQVLEGEQCDENGTYKAGDVVLNPQESEHSVWSDTGCVVLIMWERPVEIL